MGLRASYQVLLRATFRRAHFCLLGLVLCAACHRGGDDISSDGIFGDSIFDITDTTESNSPEDDPTCNKIELYRVDRDENNDGVTESTVEYRRIQVLRDAEDRITKVITTRYDRFNTGFKPTGASYFSATYDASGRLAARAETSPNNFWVTDYGNVAYVYQGDYIVLDGEDGCNIRLRFVAPHDISSVEYGIYDEGAGFAASETYPVTTIIRDGQVTELTFDYRVGMEVDNTTCNLPLGTLTRWQFGYHTGEQLAYRSMIRFSSSPASSEFDYEISYITNPLTFEQSFFFDFPGLGQTQSSPDGTRYLMMAPAAEYCESY